MIQILTPEGCVGCKPYQFLGGYACLSCEYPEAQEMTYSLLHQLRSDPMLGLSDLSPQEQEEVEFDIITRLSKVYGANVNPAPAPVVEEPQAEISEELSIIEVREAREVGSEKLRALIAILAEPVIALNRGSDDYAGLLFNKKEEEVYFASPAVIGKISSLGRSGERVLEAVPDNLPFYNFNTQAFESNPLPMDTEGIHRYIDSMQQDYIVTVPRKEVLQFLGDHFPSESDPSVPSQAVLRTVQVIIDVGCAFQRGEGSKQLIIPEFQIDSEGKFVFSPTNRDGELLLGRPCHIHKYSKLTFVDPGRSYLAEFMPEHHTEDILYLNVIRRFETKARLAIFRDRNDPPDKFDIDAYPPHDVYRCGLAMQGDSYANFESVAVNGAALYNALAIFRGFTLVNIQTGGKTEPIILEAERDSTDQPRIEIMVQPLIDGIKENPADAE